MKPHAFIACVIAFTVASPVFAADHVKSGGHIVTTTAEGAERSGPYFIEGAEPGDLIVVTVVSLEPTATTGTSASVMTAMSVDPKSIGTKGAPVPWTIDRARGVVRFDLQKVIANVDWATRYSPPVYELPLRPMLRSIGTAPGGKESIAWAGARVMLPVNEPGAMLSFGRGVARNGDGNVVGTGIETTLAVDLSVEVVKKQEWPHSSVARASTIAGEFELGWPRIETGDSLMAVGSAATLHEALQHATTELHHWLDDDFGFSERSLSIFLGPALEYEVVDVAGPVFTVIAKVKKSYIPKITPGR